MEDSIALTPTKDAYAAIKADVDENASFKELVDNALDNAQRQDRDTVTVEIAQETDSNGDQILVVRDDSGGLKPDELSMMFALGESEKDDIEGSIGAFGIGAKKALMRLGTGFTIWSHHQDAETGYGYTVEPKWFEDDDEWSVPLEEVDMESGSTEIRIHDSNVSWPNIRDGLATDLQETYDLYLRGEAPVTLRLLFPNEENANTESLTPRARVSYSYTPWDDLLPRRYEGIILTPDELSSPVYMDIEVGLLVTGNESEAGLDWVCQNRVVERANRDEVSRFGEELPKFRLSKHKRLKGRVELYTPGDASELPWNSDKSRIHARHAVTDEARDVLKKVIHRYMKAGYGVVEPAFFEPYLDSSEFAANGGEVKTVSLSDRYRQLQRGEIQQVQIQEKPTSEFPQITDMQETVEAFAQLGITYEHLPWVKPRMRPTYQALLESEREQFGCFDELEALQERPPDFTQDGRSGESERKRLTKLAQTHANQGVRYTGLAEWERPRYRLELERAVEERGIDIEALEPVDKLPDVDDDGDDDDADEDQIQLSFGPFTGEELATMQDHLGEMEEYSPQKRTEVLVEHFRRLNMAGVRFEAHAD
jgi:hypothetical protein